MTKVCLFCGKPFEAKRSSAKYCSMYCNHQYNRPHVPFLEKVCLFCGKPFKTHNSTARCCSKICADRRRRGFASLAAYEEAQSERKAAFNKQHERNREGLTLAQIKEVIDAQNGDQALLWKRSQSWSKAQHKYAKKRYQENHGLFVQTYYA